MSLTIVVWSNNMELFGKVASIPKESSRLLRKHFISTYGIVLNWIFVIFMRNIDISAFRDQSSIRNAIRVCMLEVRSFQECK